MNESWNHPMNEIAEAEAWLSTHATPAPSPEAVERAKRAMRTEAAKARQSARRPRVGRPWHGALAAAACLAFCVTVGWRSGRGSTGAGIDVEFPWVQSGITTEVENSEFAFNNIEEKLGELESVVPTDASADEATDGSSLFHVLEDAISGAETTGAVGTS